MLTHDLKVECYECGMVFYDQTVHVEDVVRTEVRIKFGTHTCPKGQKGKVVSRLSDEQVPVGSTPALPIEGR